MHLSSSFTITNCEPQCKEKYFETPTCYTPWYLKFASVDLNQQLHFSIPILVHNAKPTLPVHTNPVTTHTFPTPSNHYSPKIIIYVAYLNVKEIIMIMDAQYCKINGNINYRHPTYLRDKPLQQTFAFIKNNGCQPIFPAHIKMLHDLFSICF
jgi:hypothetical protein